jgi:DnaJ domain
MGHRLDPEERNRRVAARKAATWGGETRLKYNPDEEGYGSPELWRRIFSERMGLDAARANVGKQSPRAILGLGEERTYTMDAWKILKSAYRKLAMKFHPDNQDTGDSDRFKKIQGAYEILEDEFQRHGVDAR